MFLKSGTISDIAIEISVKNLTFWYRNIKIVRNSEISEKHDFDRSSDL